MLAVIYWFYKSYIYFMKVLKTVFIIIGAVIGAGFASGKEIFEYFAKYGVLSLLFVVPLFLCIYFFLFNYLKFGESYGNYDLKQSNKFLCKPRKFLKYNYNPFDIGLFLTFLIHTSAMFSGLIALFSTYLPSGYNWLYFIISLVVTIVLIKTSFKSFKLLSLMVVPLIIICLILNVICSFNSGTFATNFGITNILPLPILTIVYASQNTFFSSFIIIKLGKDLTDKERHLTSLITALVLCVLITHGILCFMFNPRLVYSEMPFAEVAISVNPIFSIIFALILFGSIITTHATCLASLKEYFKGEKKYNNTFLMLVLIILLSLFNFGKIVEYLYPLIGAFGIIYFYKIYTYNTIKNKIHKFLKHT